MTRRLHAAQDELEAKEVLAKYVCRTGHCGKVRTAGRSPCLRLPHACPALRAQEFDSFDMLDLIQPDGNLICTMCQGPVEQASA